MFAVTRQVQWPDGVRVVEVNLGGLDFSNPDALVPQYRGEMAEYADPKEATEVAVRIRRDWQRDSHKRISVAVGNTGGMTMPFEPSTVRQVLAWGRKVSRSLPRCPGCTDIVDPQGRNVVSDEDDEDVLYHDEQCWQRAADRFARETGVDGPE